MCVVLGRRPQAALQQCHIRTLRHTAGCLRPSQQTAAQMAHTSKSTTVSWPPEPGSHTDKVTGCFLAALCGDALGAAVEGWTAYRVLQTFPNGLTEFQHCRMGRGCYTDDGQMMLGLAASLVNNQGVCKASDIATQYAKAFDPARGYGGSAQQILAKLQQQLAQGPLPATMGTELLAQGGSYGNGGAMRVAPLGLVYRNAPVDTLHTALMQSLIPTHHVHPWAVEGALAQALAVAHLSKLQPTDVSLQQQPAAEPSAAAAAVAAPASSEIPPVAENSGVSGGGGSCGSPASKVPAGALEFLRVLQRQLQGNSDVVCSRLALMEQGLHKLYSTQGAPKQQQQQTWHAYFTSPAWHEELSTAAAVAPGEAGEGFQIKATDAVAAAIWACVAHWEGAPEDAIVAAVHYGGDTDTIACMAGALVGARHGSSWLPQQWLQQMEQDAPGTTFFNMEAVQAVLNQQQNVDANAQQQQQQQQCTAGSGNCDVALVYTTKNMGREGAMLLAQLLARLDVRSM